MLRTRALRGSLSAALSAALLTGAALLAAAPASAAESLSLTAPAADSTVAGEVRIEGLVAGEGAIDLTLSLAPQSLGECGAPVASVESQVVGGEPFAALIDTARVADGTYCIVAVADGGALSEVRGDIAIANERAAGSGVQLPTLALPGEAGGVAGGVDGGASTVPADAGPLLAGLVFGLAGIAAVLVAVFGVLHDRRPARYVVRLAGPRGR
ncbi:hypothetical protein [Microcella flavibacter]|uniref:hypothetical protein n=1 Tax=Microcella flavibacter TaxID=1804990 RepID=UPI0014567E17|nr:hypothetical protein [Microcella flavibacter]